MSAGARPRHILVLANETVAGKNLLDALRNRAAQGPIRVTVISPQNDSRAGFVVYETSRRSAADRRLKRTLDYLHEAGIAARGAVVDPDPLAALKDGIAQYEPDEIIVSTHPEVKSGWLRGNLIDRAQKAAGSIPVEHVVVDLEAPRDRAHVLVVANQTIVGDPLFDVIRERAGQSPAEFTLVAPADEPGVERRLQTALRKLESAGIDASGHLGDGDPYTAVTNAVADEPVDEIIVSTFPTSTSGWMRRDLVDRVRESTGLPVTHVVVGKAEAEAGVAS
ncbi:MAG TPA: hypothetical protein VH306_13580 [Gaiellaceae bacterium]